MEMSPAPRPQLVRTLWNAAGFVCLAVGLVGIALPLLPTTPFVLLAAFCFQRGSDRLHRWLLGHPRFGPLIRNWRERGAISRRTKRNAIIAIVAVPVVSWLAGVSATALIIQCIVLACVAAFILTRPE